VIVDAIDTADAHDLLLMNATRTGLSAVPSVLSQVMANILRDGKGHG
jgi:hypothetical protein